MNKDSYLLIVDDEIDLLKILKIQFEMEGFKVLTAQSGNEAFETYQANNVSAIISDIRMPDGDGIELLQKIKKVSTDTPIINFITGHSDLSMKDAYHLGADGIFSKPFIFDEILDHVNKLLMPRLKRWEKQKSHYEINIDHLYDDFNSDIRNGLIGIGRGGLSFMTTNNRVREGSHINFNLNFKNGTPQTICGSGVLRWEEKQDSEFSHIGVEFISLDAKCLSEVVNIIDLSPPASFLVNLKPS